MATLYLDRRDVELREAGNCIMLYEGGALQRTLPLSHIERVVITARTLLNSNVLAVLGRHGTEVAIVSRRDAEATAWLCGGPRGDARRRVGQYKLYLDDRYCLGWSHRVLEAKVRAQANFLREVRQERPAAGHAVARALRTLDELRERLTAEAPAVTRMVLMGWEGAAAAAYFSALSEVFPAALSFRGRNRRPPRDPVNACLSLAYTLLHLDASHALRERGLDPFVGFLHEIAPGRESLACDLIEPLRPRADGWIWRLFRERVLRVEHFSHKDGGCLLGKAGRAAFYEAYESFGGRMRRYLRRFCASLAKRLDSETADLGSSTAASQVGTEEAPITLPAWEVPESTFPEGGEGAPQT